MAAPKTVLTYPLNGTLKDFAIPFEYLARKFVVVTLIGATRRVLVLNSEYRFTAKKQITTTTAWGPTQGFENIEIRRVTSATERLVDFSDGSILRAYDLNTAQVQSLHIAEEARDLTADTIAVNNDGDLDARGKKIVNLADGVLPGDAVTFRQQQSWADSALNSSISAGNSASVSQASRLASEAARDVAVTNRNEAIAAKDITVSKRDEASTFANNAGVSANTATAQAGTSIVQAGVATTQAGISTSKAAESAASALTASTYATQVQYGTVPLFTVQWWGGKRSAIPAGHIPADGQAISRALYLDVTANVVAMMGTITDAAWVADPLLRGNWATGDGSTTWRVPDLNGKSVGTIGAPFLRGDGTLSAAVAGTIQRDQTQGYMLGRYGFKECSYNTGYASPTITNSGLLSRFTVADSGIGSSGTSIDYPVTDGTNGTPRVGSETRPLNVTGCFIIKVFGSVNNSGSADLNQIVTEQGLQNARINILEVNNTKVYGARQIGNEHINPSTGGAIHWGKEILMKGVTYSGVAGGRQQVLPIAGVYRITVALLSNGVASGASVRLTRAGVLQPTLTYAYAGHASAASPLFAEYLGRFNAGDAISVFVEAGQILNTTDGGQYNAFIIERIDN